MAKTIKAIICPNCGSNQKTEIKPDYFVCESCKTEYYLDSDDIHIIHTNNTSYGTPIPNQIKLSKKGVIFGILISFFLLFLILNTIFSNSTDISNSINIPSKVDLDDEKMVLCATKNNELIFVTAGIESTGDYENRKEKLVVYYDDSNGKNIKKQEVNFSIPKNKASFPIQEKYFSNGDCYLIFNEKQLFKVNPDLMEIQELKQDFFHAPEFANGIAKLEKDYTDDAFKIQTLDGKSYYYLPLIDRIIKADDYYNEQKKIPLGAINTTDFKFMNTDSGGKLIKYVRKKLLGYSSEDVYFDLKEGKPVVRSNPENLVSLEDFLPDRTFFNPAVIGQNKELLIIRFTLDATQNASCQVQALDVKTGAIRWTFDCSPLDQHVNYFPYKALSNSKVTLLEANFGGLVIDNKTGKVTASVDGR